MTIFVANVGERDLYYNIGSETEPNFCHFEYDKEPEKKVSEYLNCKHGARYISEEICGRLQSNSDEQKRLRYPIVKTSVEGTLGKVKKIDKLVLVTTNQKEGTSESFRCRDSLNTGRVIKYLIEHDYQNRINEINLIQYENHPTDRKRTYEFYGQLLTSIAPEDKVKEFHASVSGGIPALNDSLQEQAIRLYKSKCNIYSVIPPSDENGRKGADIGMLQPVHPAPFLKDLSVSIISELIDRYDYSGAIDVLRTFKAVKFWDEEVEVILRHAEFRLNLNFEESAGVLVQYKFKQPFKEWWQSVSDPKPLDRIIEAYFIAESRYRNHEYADMLWRIRSIREIGKNLHAGINYPDIKNTPLGSKWKDASKLLGDLRGLCNLANDALHELEGISVSYINNAFSAPKIIHDKHSYQKNHQYIIPTLYEIILLLSNLTSRQEPISNPYQAINDYLLSKLK